MKKFSFIFATIMASMYFYNVYADKTPVGDGCEEGPENKCQVWIVTPEGSGIILEKGYNKWEILD